MEPLKIDAITLQVTPTMDFLRDVAITAIEGGIGYWSQMVKYKWRESKSQAKERLAESNETADTEALENLRQDLPFPEAVLINIAEPDNVEHQITPELIRKGLQLAITPGICHPESNTFKSVIAALAGNDAGAIDSDAADSVVQLGLFGSIVYS